MNPVISADFPGGNVVVLGADGATVHIAPDLRACAKASRRSQPTDFSGGCGMGFSRWAATKPWPRLASGLEIPFANFREKTQTPDTVRAFGRGIAAALAEFLASPSRE